MNRSTAFLIAAVLLVSSCSSAATTETSVGSTSTTTATAVAEAPETQASGESAASDTLVTFQIEVWADNWMAVHVNGELIGEDSVPITTERSFNAEVFTFEASRPFTIAIEAKDFMETNSGIEYIGLRNQQMGDGGLIAQVTDVATGLIVVGTDSDWTSMIVQQAPLNTDCERDPDPDATCEFLITDTPTSWTSPDFDDTAWTAATEWAAADVGPKDGYDEINWDPSARLIWGTDLEVDNTILLRRTIS